MAKRNGCFLGALLGGSKAVTGGARKALPGSAIGRPERIDGKDRPIWERGHTAAVRCHEILAGRREVSDDVRRQVAGTVSDLMASINRLVEQLADARKTLKEHDPERIAREKANLELEALGASMDAHRGHKETMAAIDKRLAEALSLRAEVSTLETQLAAACQNLITLAAKLGRIVATGGVSGALEELETRRGKLDRAIEAFGATVSEMSELQ